MKQAEWRFDTVAVKDEGKTVKLEAEVSVCMCDFTETLR